MDFSQINLDNLETYSVGSVDNFNRYYRQNRERITMYQGLVSQLEGCVVGDSFLNCGFLEFGELWFGEGEPDFEVDIPNKVFLDLEYSEGDFVDRLIGFLEVNPAQQNSLYIARTSHGTLAKLYQKEIDKQVRDLDREMRNMTLARV